MRWVAAVAVIWPMKVAERSLWLTDGTHCSTLALTGAGGGLGVDASRLSASSDACRGMGNAIVTTEHRRVAGVSPHRCDIWSRGQILRAAGSRGAGARSSAKPSEDLVQRPVAALGRR